MASPSSPQHEPTMEEILASIRKIISEDSSDSQPAPVAQQPTARAPAPVAEADVLELTQEIEEVPAPAPVVQTAPAPVMVAAPQPVRPADDVVFQSIEEAPVSVVAQTPANSGGFVSDKARQAIDDSLSGLSLGGDTPAAPKPVAPRAALPVDTGSIAAVYEKAVRDAFDPVLRSWLHDQADVVIERIKPAIREWMDENLPAMLKSAVEAEVARALNKPKR